jgi:PAS domain S-box-containing protein
MIKPIAITFMKMDRQQKLTSLTQVSFYELLREDDLSFLLSSCECVSLKAGVLLFADQSLKEGMYIVLNGSLKIYKQHRHIAFRSVGDFFGEMSLLDCQPRSANVRAVSDTVLLEIDRVVFNKLIDSNPKVLLDISRALSQRQREDLNVIESSYRELKRSEEKYRHIVNLISELIIQVDPDGVIEFVNESIRVLGYEAKELIGKPFAKIYNGELDDDRKHHVLTRRTGLRAPNDMEFSLNTNPHSSLHELVPNMSFVVSATGVWNVPQEMVLEKNTQKEFLGTLLVARTEKMDLQM